MRGFLQEKPFVNPMSEGQDPVILVIEDDTDSRELLKRALELADFSVITAKEGHEALKILNEGCMPNLVLLDLSMPQMSGEEFVARMKTLPHCQDLKFIIVSGWDDLAKRSKDLGAAGFLRKPIDLRTLTREVKKQIQSQASQSCD